MVTMFAPLRCSFLATLTGSGFLQAAAVDFSHEVVPILRERCAECHTGDKKKGGLSMNDRASLLAGGENGPVVQPGQAGKSRFMDLVRSADPDDQMPPKGQRLTAEQLAVLQAWIDQGAPWQEGFAFKKPAYEPPLLPRRPELPEAKPGREHPVDRILDAAQDKAGHATPPAASDETFLRRVFLDLIGLLPTVEERQAFLADQAPDKRLKLVRKLLARDVDYAEHWLTFWNDLLRNDYSGTGFITGGRKQISKWLYDALVTNKPFDQFTRELISPPTNESAGYAAGIRWRGEVSAGQTVEIQFAQSVGQSFLGINLKCASCHDSFVDRWKLDESYGLAAIYATQPLAIHRCDKPVGRMAKAAWLFPELGQVDASAPQPKRLEQLAALLTHPRNGRFTRTLVNRLWHRLMGRGIVHPVDAMQSAPWNADLLDFLATQFQEDGYDLKRALELIATSAAYQSQVEVRTGEALEKGGLFPRPWAKRLTAEQFVDAVWALTGTAPSKADAPVRRGKPSQSPTTPTDAAPGAWIWSSEPGNGQVPPAGQVISLRRRWNLPATPVNAGVALTVDNEYTLFVNGQKVLADENWETVESASLAGLLKAGENELLIKARNAGQGPNLAAACLLARAELPNGSPALLATGQDWEWTAAVPNDSGKFSTPPAWQKVITVSGPWQAAVGAELNAQVAAASQGISQMVRASLMKSDFLMRSLGRPNRDQIVSVRPNDLTTLEAIDLANGQVLATSLAQGAKKLMARGWASPETFVRWLYQSAVCRDPSTAELAVAQEMLTPAMNEQNVEDVLWMALMLPEFQFVR